MIEQFDWRFILVIIASIILGFFLIDALWLAWNRRKHTPPDLNASEHIQDLTDEELGISSVRKLAPQPKTSNTPIAEEVTAPVKSDVLIMHIRPKQTPETLPYFPGGQLQKILLKLGFLYSHNKQIFHYCTNSNRPNNIAFSLANAYEPGTFILSEMETAHIRGILLFTRFSSDNKHALENFEVMLKIATYLTQKFDAELRDNHNALFTLETANAYRSTIKTCINKHMHNPPSPSNPLSSEDRPWVTS